MAMVGINSSALTSAFTTAVPMLAVTTASSTALLATPLFFVGFIGLATAGVKLVFGSSEGRLIVPMITILNQRLLLAVEGIKLEDYY